MKNTTICLISALGGAVVGAAVAMLVTPQSGKELRIKLHNAFDETAMRVRDDLCNHRHAADDRATEVTHE